MQIILYTLSILTVILGISGFALAYIRWQHTEIDLNFWLALLFVITAVFGITKLLSIDIDFLLYLLRVTAMGGIVYALYKFNE